MYINQVDIWKNRYLGERVVGGSSKILTILPLALENGWNNGCLGTTRLDTEIARGALFPCSYKHEKVTYDLI